MHIVDSHCHLHCLDLSLYQDTLDVVIENARQSGVMQMLNVCLHLEQIDTIVELCTRYENVYGSVGLHPTEKPGEVPCANEIVDLVSRHPKIMAIGETGLDFYYQKDKPLWQQQRFEEHIKASLLTKKPLIIHCRDAFDEVLATLAAYPGVRAIFHCFTGDYAIAKRALDLDCMISFSGIVTFKNAKALQEAAQKIPLESMLVETDSPYLAPTPFRGKPNQPAYTVHVVDFIAALRGVLPETIAAATSENFKRLIT